MTASGLVGVDAEAKLVEGEGEPDIAANCIHLGIRRVRPEAQVIMHTHQPYTTALGSKVLVLVQAFTLITHLICLLPRRRFS